MTKASEYTDEVLNDLSDYFHGAPIALHTTDADGAITMTNLAELELLGYRGHEDDYVGRHLAEFHADSEEVQSILDRLVTGEKIAEYETTLVRRDGKQQRVLLYANARVEDGQFRGLRCFTFPHPDDLRPEIAECAALTDQSIESRHVNLSPEQRRQLHDELLDFFDNGPVNLHIVGGDGLIKHANRSEIAAMGYDPDTYLGQHIARFHADQAVIDGMLEDLVGGTPLINFSATLFHKDGSKLPVMIYSNSRMRDGSFLNTRCFTVSMPKARKEAEKPPTFAWPRNEDFGFTIDGRTKSEGKPNSMTVALKYIASRKRPEESLGYLARVSEILGSGRPLPSMLGDVAGLTVPFLADFVSIDADAGHLAHAATPALRRSADALLHALGNGSVIDSLNVHEPLRVALTVRGETAGTLTLVREDRRGRNDFGPADRALAEELARRIAFALQIDRLAAAH